MRRDVEKERKRSFMVTAFGVQT